MSFYSISKVYEWLSKLFGAHRLMEPQGNMGLLQVIDEIELVTITSPMRSRVPLVPDLVSNCSIATLPQS